MSLQAALNQGQSLHTDKYITDFFLRFWHWFYFDFVVLYNLQQASCQLPTVTVGKFILSLSL